MEKAERSKNNFGRCFNCGTEESLFIAERLRFPAVRSCALYKGAKRYDFSFEMRRKALPECPRCGQEPVAIGRCKLECRNREDPFS